MRAILLLTLATITFAQVTITGKPSSVTGPAIAIDSSPGSISAAVSINISASEVSQKMLSGEMVNLQGKHIIGNLTIGNPIIPSNLTIIKSNIIFDDCQFTGTVTINRVLFLGDVTFRNSTFKKKVLLSDVRSQGYFNLIDSSLTSDLQITDSFFYNAYFSFLEVAGDTSATNLRFISEGFFIHCNFTGDVRFHNIVWATSLYAKFTGNTYKGSKFFGNLQRPAITPVEID